MYKSQKKINTMNNNGILLQRETINVHSVLVLYYVNIRRYLLKTFNKNDERIVMYVR